MKWLMAEDEMIEREGLKKMITHQFLDLELIGEARTGKEAVQIAKEQNPDFITMDIKMPSMDGIEAVKEIKALNPDIEIIMMTAYDEFEYAREVMRQGVQEYVLKPAKKSELFETFQRVMDGIQEKKRKEERPSQDKKGVMSLIQSNWMQSYFTERVMEDHPEEIASYFPESSGKGCAMIVHLENTKEYALQHQWIREELEKSTYCLVGPVQNGHFPIWIFAFKEQENMNLSKWIRKVLQRFESTFHKRIAIGIGTFYEGANQLIHSYHEAVIAMAFVNPQKGYVLYGEVKSQLNPSAFNRVVQEKKIYEAIRSGDSDLAIHQFEQLWPLLEEEEKVTSCKDLIHAIYGIMKETMAEHRVLTDFPESTNEGEWRKWTVQKIAQASDLIKSWKHVTSKDAIWKAEEWIKEHFHQPITLEDVAEHVALSPYYFSKIFKERLNKSFVDYVTDLRVMKAKEWLTTTDKPLKEISQLVGYKDPNYFSRVFKKRTNETPSAYRVPSKQL